MQSIIISPYKHVDILKYHDQQVRAFRDEYDALWFSMTDVCRAIGIANVFHAVIAIDQADRNKFCVGPQGFSWFVREKGLSSYLSRSLKEEARAFLVWITEEAWPTLRRQAIHMIEDGRGKKNLPRHDYDDLPPREIVPFTYQDHPVRVFQDDEEALWFVAKDVCDILDIKNPSDAVTKGLDDDERSRKNLGRQGEAIVISESGFYTLVIRSNKPEAKPFRRWVTHEVIPSIRKTGSYSLQAPGLTMDTVMQIRRETVAVMRSISSRNRKIMDRAVYYRNKELTFEEVGKLLDCSPDRIERLLAKAQLMGIEVRP